MRSGRRLFRAGLPPIYDPGHVAAIHYQRHAQCDSAAAHLPQATALLKYYPRAELAAANASTDNYHLLTTAQSNSTQAGVRYMRSLGANATQPGGRGGLRRRRAARRIAEPGPAPEHQLQLQLGPLGLRQREHLSAAGRQDLFRFRLGAGRLHRRLSPLHQHLQRQLEPQQQPHDQLLHQHHRRSPPRTGPASTVPNDVPLNYGLPSITLSNIHGPQRDSSRASPSRRPSRSPRR